jgi:hypothetical protein
MGWFFPEIPTNWVRRYGGFGFKFTASPFTNALTLPHKGEGDALRLVAGFFASINTPPLIRLSKRCRV